MSYMVIYIYYKEKGDNIVNSLISSDNTWMLWTVLVVWSAISIVLEQKYKWASRVTGAILAL